MLSLSRTEPVTLRVCPKNAFRRRFRTPGDSVLAGQCRPAERQLLSIGTLRGNNSAVKMLTQSQLQASRMRSVTPQRAWSVLKCFGANILRRNFLGPFERF